MITSIILANIMGIGEPGLQIEFSNNLNVIYGDNGAGKSSIWTGALLALGGYSNRSNENILRHGKDFGFAEVIINNKIADKELIEHPLTTGKSFITFRVEFSRNFDQNQNERIIRTHKVNGKLISIDRVNELLKKIEFDADDNVTFIAAGQTKNILESSNSSLLKYFEKILKLGDIRKRWNNDSLRLKETNEKINHLKLNIREKELEIADLKQKQNDYIKRLDLVKQLEEHQTNKMKAELWSIVQKHGSLDDELSELKEKKDDLNQEKMETNQSIKSLEQEMDKILNYKSVYEQEIKKLDNISNESKITTRINEKEINRLKDLYEKSNILFPDLDIYEARQKYKELIMEAKKIDEELNKKSNLSKDIESEIESLKKGLPLSKSSIVLQNTLKMIGINVKPFYTMLEYSNKVSDNEKLALETLLGELTYALVMDHKYKIDEKLIEEKMIEANYDNYLINLTENNFFIPNGEIKEINNYFLIPNDQLSSLLENKLKTPLKALKSKNFVLKDQIGYRYLLSNKGKTIIDRNKRITELSFQLNSLKSEIQSLSEKSKVLNERESKLKQAETVFYNYNKKSEILQQIEDLNALTINLSKVIESNDFEKEKITILRKKEEEKLSEVKEKIGRKKDKLENNEVQLGVIEENLKKKKKEIEEVETRKRSLENQLKDVKIADIINFKEPTFYDGLLLNINNELSTLNDVKDYSILIQKYEYELNDFQKNLDQCRAEVNIWEDKIKYYIKNYHQDLKKAITLIDSRFQELLFTIGAKGNISLIGDASLEEDTFGINVKARFNNQDKFYPAVGETIFSSGEKAAILIAFIVAIQETFLKYSFCFWDEIYEKTDPIRTEQLMKVLGSSHLTYIIISPINIYLEPAKTVYLLRKRNEGEPFAQKIPEEIIKIQYTSNKLPFALEKKDE